MFTHFSARNHYFYSEISLRCKWGSKNVDVEQGLLKKTEGIKLTLGFSAVNKPGKIWSFPICVVSNVGPFFQLSSFSRQIVLKVFWNSEGVAKKHGKNRFLGGCILSVFFFDFVSSWSPVVVTYLVVVVGKCVIHPCFLTFVFFLRWLCFLVSIHHCLYCVFYFIQFFVFAVFSLGVTKNPHQTTKSLKFWFSCSASVPASPHFHLGQIIILLGPEKNPSKCFCLVCYS